MALVGDTFPPLGLLKRGVSVHPWEIARGSREAALGRAGARAGSGTGASPCLVEPSAEIFEAFEHFDFASN